VWTPEKTAVLVPLPPLMTSLPAPPVMESLPVPAKIALAPVLTSMMVSGPEVPMTS
jgi:hypothetical protein